MNVLCLKEFLFIKGWKELRKTSRGGGRTKEKTGRGGGRTGERGGRGNGSNRYADEVLDFSTFIAQQLQDLLPTIVTQVGDHISNQRINEIRNNNAIDDSIHEDVRNINVSNAYTRWVEKMEAVQKISGCGDNQKVKYYVDSLTGKALTWWNSEVQTRGQEAAGHAMVGAGHAAYTDRFHELARLVPHLVTPKTKMIEWYIYGLAPQICGMVAEIEPPTIHNVILKAGVLTNEAIRNGSWNRSGERRGYGGELSKEGNVKGDNKRARTEKVFATITNPVRKEYTGSTPKCANCPFHHYPETPYRMYTIYNRVGYFAKDCRVGPKMVTPLNARNPTAARGACYKCGGTDDYKSACSRLNRAPGQGGNHPNQAMAIEGGQGRGNNGNPACGRGFVIGAEEARQNPNIMTGTFSLNNHYATMLFDYGADYSFVSTTFMPLLDIKPSSLGFSYEIEIARGQLVEINKVMRGCKMEIQGHTFDIDLIPFGHGSFDVIIGMEWLSRHRSEIVCRERVV
ncbi:putative reverse transcriptase domain-containing protein [Tanacetum coccineum]|uniref:Reverse transcriptase domain-containing protein n=1 Tax=Tanacetum coccineum TaxID=301880 RepID=A0ABQ5GIA2_9ASTR